MSPRPVDIAVNDVERQRMIDLLTQTWPNGPRARIWTDVLADLDHGYANIAYTRLRDRARSVSIAEFRDEYRAVRAERLPPEPPCQHCDGTGWVTVLTAVGGDAKRGAVPCPACPAGAARQRVHREILEQSARRHPSRPVADVQTELL